MAPGAEAMSLNEAEPDIEEEEEEEAEGDGHHKHDVGDGKEEAGMPRLLQGLQQA
jgi:hypothetical protein